jgi:hypothetical protein
MLLHVSIDVDICIHMNSVHDVADAMHAHFFFLIGNKKCYLDIHAHLFLRCL